MREIKGHNCTVYCAPLVLMKMWKLYFIALTGYANACRTFGAPK